MGAKVIGGSVALVTLAAGFMIGFAVPRDDDDAAQAAAQATLSPAEHWLPEVALAATSSRLDGVAVVVIGASTVGAEQMARVRDAIESAGGTVVGSATVEEAWWDPAQAAYRGSIADQITGEIAGVTDDAGASALDHALIQGVVPGLVPPGASPGEGDTGNEGGPALLADVLTRGELLSAVTTASVKPQAVVFVVTSDDDALATAAVSSAQQWELYVGATEVVMLAPDAVEVPQPAQAAIDAAGKLRENARPSIVITTADALADAQVVAALAEQLGGGTGIFADLGSYPLIALP